MEAASDLGATFHSQLLVSEKSGAQIREGRNGGAL